jgi:hypothetical protein
MQTRLPADLHCFDLSGVSLEAPPLKTTSVNEYKNSQCCEGCTISSKIALELEQCLHIIISEYEQEVSRLRMELSICQNNSEQSDKKSNIQSKDISDSEAELLLYKTIPGFKDDMRGLGDDLWSSDKAKSILYYQAAALNGCTESCVRVALHFLDSETSYGSVDYAKAKVTALFVAFHPIPKLVPCRPSSSARRPCIMRRRLTSWACSTTKEQSYRTSRETPWAWLPAPVPP